MARTLIELMRSGATLPTLEGAIEFSASGSLIDEELLAADARPIGVEQSNSSVVLDERVIVKAYRRLDAGVNPELEMLQFLGSHGFENVPELAGWWTYARRARRPRRSGPRSSSCPARPTAGVSRSPSSAAPGCVPRPARTARRGDRGHAPRARERLGGSRVRAGGGRAGGAVAPGRDDGRRDRPGLRGTARRGVGEADRGLRRCRCATLRGASPRSARPGG